MIAGVNELVTDWARLSVDYSQYQVQADPEPSGLEIYTIGDTLLHVGGPGEFTGFCGVHSGDIQARVRVLDAPPAELDSGWEAISETTLWCPSGQLSVVGLMGETADALTDVAVPRGLIRVRVHARDRFDESERTEEHPPERHEFHVWAVSEDLPLRTLLTDGTGQDSARNSAHAAAWAMLSLVPRPSGRPAPEEDDARVAVVRHRPAPVEIPGGVLDVGDLEVRLHRVDDETFTWSWATAAEPIFPRPLTVLPDNEPSTVRLTSGPEGCTLRHEGVLGRHAVALGLIWDHLLDAGGPLPWTATLRKQAAQETAAAERSRRRDEERAAEQWGGRAPSVRVRKLGITQARQLARFDRTLLDRIDALPAARQREVARWAAGEAIRTARLDRIGWINDALVAVEAGDQLPPAFTETYGKAVYDRFVSEPDLPQTKIPSRHLPDEYRASGIQEVPQSTPAFYALVKLGDEDPLVAAIDAVYWAAFTRFEDRARFLAEANVKADADADAG